MPLREEAAGSASASEEAERGAQGGRALISPFASACSTAPRGASSRQRGTVLSRSGPCAPCRAIVSSPSTISACWIDAPTTRGSRSPTARSEEHTSELQSRFDLVCRLLLEKTHSPPH